MEESKTNKKIFFYDGDCSFCIGLAKKLKHYCLDSSIVFQSFRELSEVELQSIHSELSLERLESEVQLVWNSKRYPGFFAVRKLLWQIKYFRYIAFFLYLPFVPFLGIFVLYILRYFKNHANYEKETSSFH
ncbi:MAG: DUF393 domain-containing protein [Leptospiraceae bacterium]|nr:DUF393 domain-containing protein [Leptospiraceae bacterium]